METQVNAQEIINNARFTRRMMAEKAIANQQLLDEKREKREIQELRNSNTIAIKRSGGEKEFKKSCKFENRKLAV